ncbi:MULTISPECIES: UDP-N-acetylmuramate dehydrogenase [unclassified Limnobacter]|uniref:UDP-N-acetylmuramate dehydrogenase n=1 Tax=unclassified Limnobacter TaxID=2630203 RepID=UPI000156CCD5|nr:MULTISPECIES: UDP-N-acetylmuramate dehydrogenase [unclassified Limnobacter]EDM82285.1 UDP-N-acetylmuramate dehydrogenase [Limnobacter sp. MED105]MAZ08299.1 UDP-N-acetylmuramate dehydrogenase [Sutterellaceae bacterium]|tara:strand:- start:19287 stop:20312 length:1026 start_codon:yes stop_codon:yes gene_type:complete
MSALTATHSVDLQPLHTFGLPARARELRLLTNQDDLMAFARVRQEGQPFLLLGEGSNTVFTSPQVDATIWKVALKGRRYLGCDGVHHHLRVWAGENWHHTVEWTVAMGWGGLENLALIPGCVGASPVQNIGAYGVELKDRVSAVHVFDLDVQKECIFNLDECEFAYRDSVFKHAAQGRYVITAVDFALPVQWQPVLGYGDVAQRVAGPGKLTPLNLFKVISAIRTEKLPDPAVLGNSGSFFKNPIVSESKVQALVEQFPNIVNYPADHGQVKLAAGWLIEQCGLKGYVLGGVGVYTKQSLILVNLGKGQGAELRQLIEHVQAQVQARFGVLLEPEPNLIEM